MSPALQAALLTTAWCVCHSFFISRTWSGLVRRNLPRWHAFERLVYVVLFPALLIRSTAAIDPSGDIWRIAVAVLLPILLVMALAAVVGASAQQTPTPGAVSGVVADALSGRALGGAVVTLRTTTGPARERNRFMLTDEFGRFSTRERSIGGSTGAR